MFQTLTGTWLALHVVLTLVSYGAFALAFISGIAYLVQDRQIKSHHPGKLFRKMPSLEILDKANTRSLFFGFMLLTLGLLAGFIWAHAVGRTFWIEDPKVAWASFIWVLYAFLLSMRVTARMRGRKVALISVFGFALVLISFIGINHTLVY